MRHDWLCHHWMTDPPPLTTTTDLPPLDHHHRPTTTGPHHWQSFGDRSKGINERVLRDHARTQLGDAAASLTPRALTEATLDGSVETFALARPAEANKYQVSG